MRFLKQSLYIICCYFQSQSQKPNSYFKTSSLFKRANTVPLQLPYLRCQGSHYARGPQTRLHNLISNTKLTYHNCPSVTHCSWPLGHRSLPAAAADNFLHAAAFVPQDSHLQSLLNDSVHRSLLYVPWCHPKKPRNWHLGGRSCSKESGTRRINIPSPHPPWENSEHSMALPRSRPSYPSSNLLIHPWFIAFLLSLSHRILSLVLPVVSSQMIHVAKSLFQDVLLGGLNPKEPYSLRSCEDLWKWSGKKKYPPKKVWKMITHICHKAVCRKSFLISPMWQILVDFPSRLEFQTKPCSQCYRV